MDGLIPMVYKSLMKRSKSRMQYKCLSSSSPSRRPYNIADFYMTENDDDDDDHRCVVVSGGPGPNKVHGLRGALQRRYNNSVHVEEDRECHAAKRNNLVRFRSHKVFSLCVTA